jgi:hypothetical protein
MLSLSIAVVIWSTPTLVPPACWGAAAAQKGDEAAPKALDEWLDRYAKGQLDVANAERRKGKRNTEKNFVSVQHGVIPQSNLMRIDHQDELRQLCEKVAARNDGEGAKLLLRVAATGLDDSINAAVMVPGVVREIGEEFAAKLQSKAARDAILEVATKGIASPRGSNARRAAALRVLGGYKDATYLPVLQGGLAHDSSIVRLAAVEGLAATADAAALPPLAAHLVTETDEVVMVRGLDGTAKLAALAPEKLDAGARSAVLSAALGALGKRSWRVDLAALAVLRALRPAEAVPALIDLIAAHRAEGGTSVKVAGTVEHEAGELLCSLTGKAFKPAEVDLWRQWWQQNKTGFAAAPAAAGAPEGAAPAAGPDAGTPATVPAAAAAPPPATPPADNVFYGIPVQGRRVLFVLDASSGMSRRGNEAGDSRIDIARREVMQAVERLPGGSTVTLITFNMRAQVWKADFAPTAPTKKALEAFLAKIRPDLNRDLWAAMVLALEPKSFAYGEPLKTRADEVFLVASGGHNHNLSPVADPRHIARLLRDLHVPNKVRVNTIYVGSADDDRNRQRQQDDQPKMSDEELLRAIAKDSGGRFAQPSKAK